MLYHPFVNWDDLLSVDSQVYTTYVNAFHVCIQQHVYPEDFYIDWKELGELGLDLDTDLTIAVVRMRMTTIGWLTFEIFARQRSQDDFPHVDISDGLGYQDVNRDYNWLVFFSQYDRKFKTLHDAVNKHHVPYTRIYARYHN